MTEKNGMIWYKYVCCVLWMQNARPSKVSLLNNFQTFNAKCFFVIISSWNVVEQRREEDSSQVYDWKWNHILQTLVEAISNIVSNWSYIDFVESSLTCNTEDLGNLYFPCCRYSLKSFTFALWNIHRTSILSYDLLTKSPKLTHFISCVNEIVFCILHLRPW